MTLGDNSYSSGLPPGREFRRRLVSRIARFDFARLAMFAGKTNPSLVRVSTMRGSGSASVWRIERPTKSRVHGNARRLHESSMPGGTSETLARGLTDYSRVHSNRTRVMAATTTHRHVLHAVVHLVNSQMLPAGASGRSDGLTKRSSTGATTPVAELFNSPLLRTNGAPSTTLFSPPLATGPGGRARALTAGRMEAALRPAMTRVAAGNQHAASLIESFKRASVGSGGTALETRASGAQGGEPFTARIERAARQSRRIVAAYRRNVLARFFPRGNAAEVVQSVRGLPRFEAPAPPRPHPQLRMIPPAFRQSSDKGGIVINYTPNVTVNGGMEMDDIDSLLIDAMRRHGHEVARILDRESTLRRRSDF